MPAKFKNDIHKGDKILVKGQVKFIYDDIRYKERVMVRENCQTWMDWRQGVTLGITVKKLGIRHWMENEEETYYFNDFEIKSCVTVWMVELFNHGDRFIKPIYCLPEQLIKTETLSKMRKADREWRGK